MSRGSDDEDARPRYGGRRLSATAAGKERVVGFLDTAMAFVRVGRGKVSKNAADAVAQAIVEMDRRDAAKNDGGASGGNDPDRPQDPGGPDSGGIR